MAKTKKAFDRELMYKKIMPTNLKKDEIEQNEKNEIAELVAKNDNAVEIINQNKEIILYNITERLVMERLESTLGKMNCCRCDRCREDIVAIALNNLKPKYIVTDKNNIKDKVHSFNYMGREVTTEIIKAVLIVRKNPRH